MKRECKETSFNNISFKKYCYLQTAWPHFWKQVFDTEFHCDTVLSFGLRAVDGLRIYLRKSGEKISGKKPGNKNFRKNPNFFKSLEKMSLEIKSCVFDSWIPGTFLVWNFRTFFRKLFFQGLFWRLPWATDSLMCI